MRTSRRATRHLAGSAAALVATFVLCPATPASAEALSVEAGELRIGTGERVRDARVVIEDGRIVAVGPAAVTPSPAGARSLRAPVVTPGFIDAHTSAGLSGLRNVASVLDQDERFRPDQSALRAIDAFDPRDPLLRYLLEHGVTIVQTGPGPRNPIAGQAGIFRTHGRSADQMALRFPSAMVFNLGDVPKASWAEATARGGRTTRMGTAALIRERLHAARAHGGLFGGGQSADLGLDALRQVTRGRLPAIFVARRGDDLLTAIRIGREFGLETILASATEGYQVADALVEAAVPVLVGPVMERVATPETENASYENAARLHAAGIPIAIRSGFESYVPKNRVLLFEAAIAVANGLSAEAALSAITRAPAEILGIDDDHGSIEVGKVADLVLFDGDPFEYTSHVTAVVVAGEVVHER